MTQSKTTWLQAVIPTSDWEKLNGRRQKLGAKWNQLIPQGCDMRLKQLEAMGKDELAQTLTAASAAGKKPASAPAQEPAKDPTMNKGKDKKPASGKGKDKKPASGKGKEEKK